MAGLVPPKRLWPRSRRDEPGMAEERDARGNSRLWLWSPPRTQLRTRAGATSHADLASAPSIMFTAFPMP